jgi:hypothetical protein
VEHGDRAHSWITGDRHHQVMPSDGQPAQDHAVSVAAQSMTIERVAEARLARVPGL